MITLRGLTRYLYLANLCTEKAITQDIIKRCYLEAKFIRDMQIPVSVFRPFRIGMKISIDPRRSKRYLRNKYKGATIISMDGRSANEMITVIPQGSDNLKRELKMLFGNHPLIEIDDKDKD